MNKMKSGDKDMSRGGVIRFADVTPYSPANHNGTTNWRLIGQNNGAKHMEILIGEFASGGNALPHAHPDLEQAVYVLEGKALAGTNGVEEEVNAGDMMFFPAGVYHSLKVLSDKVKLLVVYSPPYGEDPKKVLK